MELIKSEQRREKKKKAGNSELVFKAQIKITIRSALIHRAYVIYDVETGKKTKFQQQTNDYADRNYIQR